MQATEPDELADLLRRGAVMVDTRPWELSLKRPLAAAVHLPLEKIQSGATPDVSRDATVVVVCEWGRKSALAGLYLEARGFTDVRHLLGGVVALASEPGWGAEEREDEGSPTDATPGTEPH